VESLSQREPIDGYSAWLPDRRAQARKKPSGCFMRVFILITEGTTHKEDLEEVLNDYFNGDYELKEIK